MSNRLGLHPPEYVPEEARRLTVLLVDELSEICCDLAAAMKLAGAAVIRVSWTPETMLDLPDLLDRVDAVALPSSWPIEVAQRTHAALQASAAGRSVLVYCDGPEAEGVARAGLVALRWPFVDIDEVTEVLVTAVSVQRAQEEAATVAARAAADALAGEPKPVAELIGRLVDYQRELRTGREIQRGFLPRPVVASGWEVEARLAPAREVAGDFYDVFDLLSGRRTALVVADVCDKGVAAALFMALIRTLLRQIAEAGDPGPLIYSLLGRLVDRSGAGGGREPSWAAPLATLPAAGTAQLMSAIRGTNDYLVRMHGGQGYFATIFFGLLDPSTGRLLYVNAGHLPGTLLRADGAPELLEVTGPAVGLLPDADYQVRMVEMRPGDALLLHTDGITDARNSDGHALGLLRLHAEIQAPGPTAAALLDRVDGLVQGHVGGTKQYDDMTTMALRRSVSP
jgi:serine phosphatase RsbU (regulator of sigma subunit)